MRLASVLILALFVALGCASPMSTPRSPEAPAGSAAASFGAPADSLAPSPRLTPVPTQPGLVTIDYPTQDGDVIPLSLTNAKASGLVVRLAMPGEETVGEKSLDDVTDTGLVQLSPQELLLTWVGGPCERGFTLSRENPTRVTIAGAPRPACDTARVIFFAVLSFPDEIDATSVTMDLQPPVILGG